ncbi:MAG: sterol desaturase family protein [Saprospiraceae bacterium]|nr:sterol desaturase family protein [Saprospiraceae bacterium]
MTNYLDVFLKGYRNYAQYLWQEISNPSWNSYLVWLILVSAFFFLLEWIKPWRTDQAKFRRDFWLDFFYMFFNFFLFSLIIYNAASDVVVVFFNETIQNLTGFDLQASNPLNDMPYWAILLVGFLVRDFVQWWTHRLLHYHPRLWEFHKVHHSVKEMGFAAHLRYHWMETVVYRSLEYIPLALLGIGLYDFFIIHIFTLAVGHYNHSNISVSGKWTGLILATAIGLVAAFGWLEFDYLYFESVLQKFLVVVSFSLFGYFVLGRLMKYIFNSPEMHIWHHAYEVPDGMRYGVNFGLTLALWDYFFGTARIPYDGRDIELGFPGVESFPGDFAHQAVHGLYLSKKSKDPGV